MENLKELQLTTAKLKKEIKQLTNNANKLSERINDAKNQIKSVEQFKKSDNPREKMIYLEAQRVYVCLKNDLVNMNLLKLFKEEELSTINSKLEQSSENFVNLEI